jgi:3-isopropylmalate/(R)-2-methylmalate dehydratase small subunit
MTPVTHVRGVAAALMRDNIDTDVIIPSREITSPSREGFGVKLFSPWRYLGPGGAENPDFILNRGAWRQARILISGRNFGCGSSREMAVWAIAQFGIGAIVAPSFGAIFRDNCVRNGIVPIVLPHGEVETLAAEAASGSDAWQVDVAAGELRSPGGEVHLFALDDGDRQRLLTGHDAVTLTLQTYGPAIDRFEAQDRVRRPWVWLDRQA